MKESPNESLITHTLNQYFAPLGQYGSTNSIRKSIPYRALHKEIERVLGSIEYGHYAPSIPLAKKPFYRAVVWNLERGIHHEHQLRMMKMHPHLSQADLFFLPETDIGMARSQNINVARKMAKELKFNYFFSPSYLNLCKGNSAEDQCQGDNAEALHGNAILSRYPIQNLRIIPLINCKDKMKGKEKRLGCQKALVGDVIFPHKTITVVTAHLDAHSSQKQRAFQMETIMSSLKNNPHPILLGGDLNTSTYNASHAVYAFFDFWIKVFRGVDHAIDDHYPYPDRYYDKALFDVLRSHGMEYESLNEIGVGTLHYRVEDMKSNHMMQEVVPAWCRKIVVEILGRHGGKVSLKLDWFAARGVKLADEEKGAIGPKVIPGLKFGDTPLSDHDPIVLDFDIY